MRIEHPEHGLALVRDDKPMQEGSLKKCLVGMTPREWYEHLNRRVFFWAEKEGCSSCWMRGRTGTGRTLFWR